MLKYVLVFIMYSCIFAIVFLVASCIEEVEEVTKSTEISCKAHIVSNQCFIEVNHPDGDVTLVNPKWVIKIRLFVENGRMRMVTSNNHWFYVDDMNLACFDVCNSSKTKH